MNKIAIKIIMPVSILLPLLISFPLLYKIGIERPNYYRGNERTKEIIINKGLSTSEISDLLAREHLVNSSALLKIYLTFNRNKKIQAGRYNIPTNLNIKDLVDLLGKGSFDKKLTFIEGLRIEEIASYLNEAFESADGSFGEGFIKSQTTKEGYMFPDTYFFFEDANPNDISKKLRNTFKERIEVLQKEVSKSTLTLDEIVKLASIVEREAKKDEDRRIIAGILIKRYKNDWPLQADATVQYAIANNICKKTKNKCEWWPKITLKHLNINSPYNTYKHSGLPPTPICNPGLSSIKAVLNYKETPYWYYLTDKDGTTHYAKTSKEHIENIRKYL